MPNLKKLKIYIPSFNRYDLLITQVDKLVSCIELNQIKNVQIVIRDNASTDRRYTQLPTKYFQDYVIIKRNPVNIGLVGNLINGFLEKDWDYIWLLSDDDIL